MSKITLTKESMEGSFIQYMEKIFELPEIVSGCVKKNVITRGNLQDEASDQEPQS